MHLNKIKRQTLVSCVFYAYHAFTTPPELCVEWEFRISSTETIRKVVILDV